ncbi:MAG: methionine--tRNA ligase [Candidatus Thermoplasmatota archaeon]
MKKNKQDTQRIFIGVAWPYANGSLHLGHMAGCYLPADIFARYNRMRGREVLMVSGSDEHGAPITITAEQEGLTPQVIVDRYHKEHKENMQRFGISFDIFTRTTTNNHKRIVQNVFLKLYDKGYIYPKDVEVLYCDRCKRALPDRYIEGKCPCCGHDKARGDQCDQCGRVLDCQELIDAKCRICGGKPKKKLSTHFFFALNSFEPRLREWLKDKSYWKANVINFTMNWLKNGLNDRAITRDLNWGINVPIPEYAEKRLYVWFDAVIGYLSASVEWAEGVGDKDRWEYWWRDKNAKHYYFLAKDNIPFHTLIWPSILMGYDESLQLPYDIPANEYLCLEGEHFSKSRGVAVWVPDILKRFDPDAVRYYLSINMPEQRDTNWVWSDFIAKNNDELVGTYGNFIHRVLRFTQKNLGVIPEKKGSLTEADKQLLDRIKDAYHKVGESIETCQFKQGLRTVMNLSQAGNVYFDHEQPWSLIKNDKDRCSTVLNTCLRLVQALTVYMYPYLPFSSECTWRYLGNQTSLSDARWEDALKELNEGFRLERPAPLFKKLELSDYTVNVDPFSKLDLRVGQITRVDDHPNADNLYMLDVDLGAYGKRLIVAGIKPYYTKEELKDKLIIIVVNLKPAKLRGVESKGMLLAAEDDKGNVALLSPRDCRPGEEVSVDGVERRPVQLLEFSDFKQVSMIIDEDGEASYNNKKLKINDRTIQVDRVIKPGAKIL